MWKAALLASGLPLELAASRTLSDAGALIVDSADRAPGVDLHGRLPLSGGNGPPVLLEIPLICLHRDPEAAIICLPAPAGSDGGGNDLFSGEAVRVMDQFSPWVLGKEAFTLSTDLIRSRKALELHRRTGEARDDLIPDALTRLQFSLPGHMAGHIASALTGPEEGNLPVLICPVVLTNLPLYLLRPDLSPDAVHAAEDLPDIGQKTDWLSVSAPMTAEFNRHCRDVSGGLASLLRTDKALAVEMKKARLYNNQFNLPFTIIDGLMEAAWVATHRFFSRFLICRETAFADWLKKMKGTVDLARASAREAV